MLLTAADVRADKQFNLFLTLLQLFSDVEKRRADVEKSKA